MTAVERATEIIEQRATFTEMYRTRTSPERETFLANELEVAQALDAAGLLRPEWATAEAKEVLDVAVRWHKAKPYLRSDLDLAVMAYLASRQVTT